MPHQTSFQKTKTLLTVKLTTAQVDDGDETSELVAWLRRFIMTRPFCRSSVLVLIVLWSGWTSCRAWVECPAASNAGGGDNNEGKDTPNRDLCPDGNTCCESCSMPHITCITSHKNESGGRCCMDVNPGWTGCGPGYECAAASAAASDERSDRGRADDDDDRRYYCVKTKDDPDSPSELPRYKLCSLPPEAYTRLHGLPVDDDNNVRTPTPRAELAYLSTMGALDSPNPADLQRHLRVETVVVMIHGSDRNVDDYLCTTNAALPDGQQVPDTSTILVVAPWFLSDEDGPVTIYRKPDVTALRWLEEGPIEHTWRYGADAINGNVSSYAAADAILDRLLQDRVRFPSLKRAVVAGHSAGGQYVQRWALLSNSPALAPNSNDPTRTIAVRTVVANPKSFCWLDSRRYVGREFRVPDAKIVAKCPEYDQWEWGLAEGNYLPTPYKDAAIQRSGGTNAVIHRYATRDVVYLAGELDVLPNGVYCMERIQGKYRRIRSERFYESLKVIYGRQVHRRAVVKGVHHDHALMFQSPEGQQALWDEEPTVRWG